MKKIILVIVVALLMTGCSNSVNELHPYEPQEFNVGNLNVNAKFKVPVSSVSSVADNMYWVPAGSLGKPDTITKELIEMKGQPKKLKEEIDNVFEVLAYVQAVRMNNYSGNETIYTDNKRWEISASPEYTIKNNEANCFAMSNTVAYLLEDDYDEVGIVWWTIPGRGGHLYNYVIHQGNYYIFSALAYTMAEPGERGYPGNENGAGNGYTGNLRGLVHQIKNKNGKPNFDAWFQLEKHFKRDLTFMVLIPSVKIESLGTSTVSRNNTYYVSDDFPLGETIFVQETPVQLIQDENALSWESLY